MSKHCIKLIVKNKSWIELFVCQLRAPKPLIGGHISEKINWQSTSTRLQTCTTNTNCSNWRTKRGKITHYTAWIYNTRAANPYIIHVCQASPNGSCFERRDAWRTNTKQGLKWACKTVLLQSWRPCLPVGAFITPQLTSQSSQPSSANYLQCLRYSPSQLLRWNKNMGQKRTEAGMMTLLGKNKEQGAGLLRKPTDKRWWGGLGSEFFQLRQKMCV